MWAARCRSQAGDLAFQPGLLHQPVVAGGDRLRHGELVRLGAEVFERADAAVAGQRGGDEARLALVVLPTCVASIEPSVA